MGDAKDQIRVYVDKSSFSPLLTRFLAMARRDKVNPNPARLSLKRRQYGARIFSLSRQPICAPRVYVDDFKKG
jgi:hypothetical protein